MSAVHVFFIDDHSCLHWLVPYMVQWVHGLSSSHLPTVIMAGSLRVSLFFNIFSCNYNVL